MWLLKISSNFTGDMKKIIIMLAVFCTALNSFAETPAASLVEKYKDVKGARNFAARGVLMKMARPMMKEYSIAPLAHKVEELSVLRMDRVADDVLQTFNEDLKIVLSDYVYVGKSDTNHGVVDAYVHLARPHVADELVVYNEEINALYSLSGTFTEEELLKIRQPVN